MLLHTNALSANTCRLYPYARTHNYHQQNKQDTGQAEHGTDKERNQIDGAVIHISFGGKVEITQVNNYQTHTSPHYHIQQPVKFHVAPPVNALLGALKLLLTDILCFVHVFIPGCEYFPFYGFILLAESFYFQGGIAMKIAYCDTKYRFTTDDEAVNDGTIREEMKRALIALESAYCGFDYATDPDMIDCHIFRITSALKRYRYLLLQAETCHYTK